MDPAELDALARLSPFELKNRLVALAASHAERVMLNAGRGNPNFLAREPRHAFFQLGLFAMSEAERCGALLPAEVAGVPRPDGIATRFAAFAQERREVPGIAFLTAAVSYTQNRLGFSGDEFLHELTQGVLGCQYPEPVRMLRHAETIMARYLAREVLGGVPPAGGIDLFAVEGGTAGITYVFNTLRENRLLNPGDTIAIGMPIFTPYIEIPLLGDYQLAELAIHADPEAGWQYPAHELDKLLDPRVKALLLVNPGNPTSVKIDDAGLAHIARIVATHRPDLIILTDDVYATFADDFVSLFARCPANTILVYSFSKYFGTTGWRLGVVATARANVLDGMIAALPEGELGPLDMRYSSLVVEPRKLKFIDRLAADSRAVALNHTAGLSTPQQVQMALFALFGLIDEAGGYKSALQRLIRARHRTLYEALGIDLAQDPNAVDYYAVLDLEILGTQVYGRGFVDWLLATRNPLEILLRLADEAGIVLLPGRGFGTPHPSARVSLANLDDEDYARLGRIVRSLMAEYFAAYAAAASPDGLSAAGAGPRASPT